MKTYNLKLKKNYWIGDGLEICNDFISKYFDVGRKKKIIIEISDKKLNGYHYAALKEDKPCNRFSFYYKSNYFFIWQHTAKKLYNNHGKRFWFCVYVFT